ncbi:molybdenum ABC transporter ATP-binding protein [Tautonia plasticadhaerens]|uniref:Fe(3+) ions import ATP-binding protein FbpC n=1 Tax=Tautonia plasticadhaerens TaxID=2527974 RepID=A0A518H203_9BACT|nr:ATP-binding cassette domain-containing protein [Tautonia plasticadhaerens]QDV34850.1 Fe(3+) ions import ATP-binding protein FbpC [Tautonia plasticadhaerens]
MEASLEVGREVVVLFGRSGAGKTTLLRMIAGLERPDSGSVLLGGRTLFDSGSNRSMPLRSRRIGMIFQHDLLFPHLGVRENLRFGLAGWPKGEAEARVREVAGLCGVSHLLGRAPGTLSGGERQRVGMARALAPRPELLLCDEPFSALDLEARDALVDRLRVVQRAEGLPVLYVTHSPAEAIALGDRLVLLDGGRIRAEGPPLDVLAGRSASGPGSRLEGVRNVFRGRVVGHEGGSTRVAIGGGPELVVPQVGGGGEGSSVVVSVRADDILLALGPVGGLSARNAIPGVVDRVVPHDGEAEVVVASGRTQWIVSVVAGAVSALALQPGVPVRMIVKARSCRVAAEAEDVPGPGPGPG